MSQVVVGVTFAIRVPCYREFIVENINRFEAVIRWLGYDIESDDVRQTYPLKRMRELLRMASAVERIADLN